MFPLPKLKKIFLLVFVFSFIVCASADFSEDENTEVASPDVTSTMIDPSQNAAGLTFLATPNADDYSKQQKIAADNSLMWANTIAKREGSTSALFSEGSNQLSHESGFTFTILTTGQTDGKSAILGLNALFYFTPENLGQWRYERLRSKLEAEESYEGWVFPSASSLADVGLSVRIRYLDGKERDITSLMSFGINIEEIDSDKLLFSYGAVIVDRAVTDNEGQTLLLSEEEEVLLSDGKKDGIFTGTWWIAANDVNTGGGGCNSGVLGGGLAVIIAARAAIIVRKRLK
jgi:hypothetical protein